MKKRNDDITVTEASEILGVTTRSVINYVKSREIEGVKVGKSWFLKIASVESFKSRYSFSQQSAVSSQLLIKLSQILLL
jgi:excisionase family DNA binding protein